MSDSKDKVIIAGGSGFLGLNLARALLVLGYEVVILSRSVPKGEGDWTHAEWDGRSLGPWVDALENSTAIVNLAGRTVDCVKTPEHCDEILRSRVESTRILGKALQQCITAPPVWVQMSTAHIVGDPASTLCTEDAAPGLGLAPIVAQAWEAACNETAPSGMRKVFLRTSFVLGKNEGALQRLGMLTKIGLGGTVGHGKQGISWIHEDDMSQLMIRAITNPRMEGAYMATAPNPVSNAEFMKALRKAIGMPIGLPAFAWMVRIGAPLLLHTDPELALLGRYCKSQRLETEGFVFKYPKLDSALAAIYR